MLLKINDIAYHKVALQSQLSYTITPIFVIYDAA